jgi:hypothetical protein
LKLVTELVVYIKIFPQQPTVKIREGVVIPGEAATARGQGHETTGSGKDSGKHLDQSPG